MRKINDLLLALCKYAVILMVPIMTGIIFVQVVLRYVFQSPFSWAEELARYLLIWITCLGSAYAIRDGMHISINYLRSKLTGSAQTAVTVAIHVLALGFFVYCVKEGSTFSLAQWTQRSTAMQIPMTIPYLAIPLGFAIMFLVALECFIDEIRKPAGGNTAA
ncbi:MAG: TRAP transporter small permease [Desulfobacterales bacterium]|nr:MAG: TRAP transporter small permease [Desulfobacterales bacterium]